MLRRTCSAVAVALTLVGVACAPAAPATSPIAALPPAPAPGPEAKLHVLLINGGGIPDINYQPHLLHLRAMRDMLLASGIKPDQIAIFAGDGDDPAPDLVVQAELPPKENAWLVRATRAEHLMDAPRQTVTSHIDGAQMMPATKDALKQWFVDEAKVLKAGDTLLLYVTDHGNRGPDPLGNTIQLWGKDQTLSVKELEELLHALPTGVRVVSVMSQCFSGGFASMSIPASDLDPRPNVCGYFSTTPDRRAYGCYPQNIGKERVGHSFHFLRALASSRKMSSAHDSTVVLDDTPDVPVRSSDALVDEILEGAAKQHGTDVKHLSAAVLGPSWRDDPRWADARTLSDRLAGEFGMVSPQTLAEAEEEQNGMATLSHDLETAARQWESVLADATNDNLDHFLAANPAWDEKLKAIDGDPERKGAADFLTQLAAWTPKETRDRIQTLDRNRATASDAAYRADVRAAVALRLEVQLTTIAGRAYLEREGTKAQQDDYAAVRACEDVTLPGAAPPPAPNDSDAERVKAFPAVGDEWRVEKDVRPPWIGIALGQVNEDLRKEHGLPDGVSQVTAIVPGSPAKEAGLEVGDLILGTPTQPFTHRAEIRQWTIFRTPGEKGALKVLRGGKEIEVALVPRAMPENLPAATGPAAPEVGLAAPPVSLRHYRGDTVNLKDGKAHLLLFWATWCHFCKDSLPEVLAFEKARHVEVVAITDEPPATLDKFFASWKTPFPKTVAIDDLQTAKFAYAVPAMPTYVLIDEKGVVRARGTGYARPQGLQIAGWKWNGK